MVFGWLWVATMEDGWIRTDQIVRIWTRKSTHAGGFVPAGPYQVMVACSSASAEQTAVSPDEYCLAYVDDENSAVSLIGSILGCVGEHYDEPGIVVIDRMHVAYRALRTSRDD